MCWSSTSSGYADSYERRERWAAKPDPQDAWRSVGDWPPDGRTIKHVGQETGGEAGIRAKGDERHVSRPTPDSLPKCP